MTYSAACIILPLVGCCIGRSVVCYVKLLSSLCDAAGEPALACCWHGTKMDTACNYRTMLKQARVRQAWLVTSYHTMHSIYGSCLPEIRVSWTLAWLPDMGNRFLPTINYKHAEPLSYMITPLGVRLAVHLSLCQIPPQGDTGLMTMS